MIPLYGKIAAGTPIEAIANPSEYIYIPKSFSTQSELYALTIEGESMVEAGILTVIRQLSVVPTAPITGRLSLLWLIMKRPP